MAIATAGELCTAALKEIAVVGEGDTASAAAVLDALTRLNSFINTCAADNLTIYSVTRTTATLTASQASFTVGAGGNINIARPVFIEKVNFIDTSTTPDTEYSLGPLLTEAEYQAVTLKALTGTYPTRAYYSPTFPTGTLYPLPIPTSATLQWAVYAWTAVTEFALPSTSISLPPAYEEMLLTNLAVLLTPMYDREPRQVLFRRAGETMATLKRANTRLVDLSFDAGAALPDQGFAWSIVAGP